jgi:hypothetical protein
MQAIESKLGIANDEFERDEDGLYNYNMPTIYGGIIVDAFEKQLATISGVGIQLELF